MQITLPSESYWNNLLKKLKGIDGRPGDTVLREPGEEPFDVDRYYSAAPEPVTATTLALVRGWWR